MATPLITSPSLDADLMPALLELGSAVTYDDFSQGVIGLLDQCLPYNVAEVRLKIFDPKTDAAAHIKRSGVVVDRGYNHDQWQARRELAPVYDFMTTHPGTKVYQGWQHTLPAPALLEKSPFYREFMGPEGWHDYLGMGFWNRQGRDGWIFVNRAVTQPRFNDREVALFQRLYGYLAGVLQRIELLHEERARRADLEDSLLDIPIASMILDWNLQVEQANRAAQLLCATWLWGARAASGRQLPHRPEVPVEVLQACRELAAEWRECGGQRALRRVVDHPAQAGLQATITVLRPHAVRLATPSFLIRITEVERHAPEREYRREQVMARLSPAERRVAEHLLRGSTNKEIAAELGKSLATVKNQIHALLAKSGVASRAQLLAIVS